MLGRQAANNILVCNVCRLRFVCRTRDRDDATRARGKYRREQSACASIKGNLLYGRVTVFPIASTHGRSVGARNNVIIIDLDIQHNIHRVCVSLSLSLTGWMCGNVRVVECEMCIICWRMRERRFNLGFVVGKLHVVSGRSCVHASAFDRQLYSCVRA